MNVLKRLLWRSSPFGSASVEYVVPGALVALVFLVGAVVLGPNLVQWFSNTQGGNITNGLIAVQPLGSHVTFPTPSGGGGAINPLDPPPAGWTQTCFSGGLCVNIPPTPPVTSAGLGNQQISIFASMLQSLTTQLGNQLPPNDPLIMALRGASDSGNMIGDNWNLMSGAFSPYYNATTMTWNNNYTGPDPRSLLNGIQNLGSSLTTQQTDINTLLNSPRYQGLLNNNPGLGNLINFLITGITSLSSGFSIVPPNYMGTGEAGNFNLARLNAYNSYLNAAGLQGIANGTVAPPPPPPPPGGGLPRL
ncbi:MAG: hypothetical protein K2X01_02285 [Cyanobacteria bacterium]|nr:hypothetical protein [Cyanobacteriota bacterium]